MAHRVVRIVVAVVFVLAFWATAAAQMEEEYLDAYVVKVKPDKRAQFDAISKRMAEANRGNNGDAWLAMETVYGDADTVSFISRRSSYGDIEKGMGAFMGALGKAYGEQGVQKIFGEFSSCVVSSRGELRRRRYDLSSNVPKDASEMNKLIGQTRYLRTTVVHVKPGRILDFEALVKEVKAAREKSAPNEVQLVSQGVAGYDGTVFYVTMFKPSLAGFDSVPSMQKLLGDEGYQKWLRTSADVVDDTRTMISRFLPELSNAPAEVVAAAPDYWTPKPVVAKKSGKSKVTTSAAQKEEKKQ
jgi:hypothetical protein